jgi:hypothetical protein
MFSPRARHMPLLWSLGPFFGVRVYRHHAPTVLQEESALYLWSHSCVEQFDRFVNERIVLE